MKAKIFLMLLVICVLLSGCVADKPNGDILSSDMNSTANTNSSTVELVQDGYTYEIVGNAAKIISHQDDGSASATIPNTLGDRPVEVIGDNSFYQHKTLKSVVLPNSLTTLEDSAFYRCYALEKVQIPAKVSRIGSNPFFRCSSLTDITVDAKNSYYASHDGVLYSKDMKILISYPEGKTNDRFVVPDTVISLSDDSFGYHPRFTELVIHPDVTDFPDYNMFIYPDEITLIVTEDSDAHQYALKHELKFEIK